MLGSKRRPYTPITHIGPQIFSVRLPGRTMWGWQRLNRAGVLLARSEHLFPDYVACLCDAHRHF